MRLAAASAGEHRKALVRGIARIYRHLAPRESNACRPGRSVRHSSEAHPGRAADTDGRIAVDLRFAVFTRIARDDVLKRLLVNYADRLDDPAVGDGPGSDPSSLPLEGAADDRTPAPPEAESVTF